MRPPAALLAVLAAVAATAAVAAAPAAAGGDWRVTTVGSGPSWLSGLVGLDRGRLAVVLDERVGGRHRLVVRTGARARTLASGRHSFEGTTARADGRGRLTVAWAAQPGRGGVRQAFAWSGGRTQQITAGPRRVTWLSLAVAADGAAVLAVGNVDGVLVARRAGPGRFGPAEPLPGLAGLARVAESEGAVAAAALSTPRMDEIVATVARRLSDPFAAPAPVGTPAPPPGTVSELSPPVAAFAPDGSVVIAFSAVHWPANPPEEQLPPALGASVYAAVWPRDAAGPLRAVELSRRRFASDPAGATAADGRRWLAWHEGGACCGVDAVAAAPLEPGRVGPMVTRGVKAPALSIFQPPAVGAASGGGLRFYLPGATRRSAALRTLRLAPGGTFGAPERIASGRAVAPPSFVVLPIPARGRPVDAVAWNAPTRPDFTRWRARLARR